MNARRRALRAAPKALITLPSCRVALQPAARAARASSAPGRNKSPLSLSLSLSRCLHLSLFRVNECTSRAGEGEGDEGQTGTGRGEGQGEVSAFVHASRQNHRRAFCRPRPQASAGPRRERRERRECRERREHREHPGHVAGHATLRLSDSVDMLCPSMYWHPGANIPGANDAVKFQIRGQFPREMKT